ncbi:uncharacterized protein LOC115619637 isoform X1 [Strigops habroptila]|uniref:uncharacterized protein LOC115619637 isoform X1 n=1 Tax=Strigops habroptila TaxID=2489341 RepID=UPI0011D005C8|nr:uncharacterized protein LOC115619637 isoform X1 [Strigops habroptila]
MTQQWPACCRDSSRQKESVVLIVSGRLALALLFLQRWLTTCTSTVKEITQMKSGCLMILCLIFSAAVAGAYFGTFLPIRMLRAQEASQVLLDKPVNELMSVWNSLSVLGEQAEGVQQLRKEVKSLVAEMRHVKKELQDMRMAMSAMPLEENVQMSAWTLKSEAGYLPGILLASPSISEPGGHSVARTSPANSDHCAAPLEEVLWAWGHQQRPARFHRLSLLCLEGTFQRMCRVASSRFKACVLARELISTTSWASLHWSHGMDEEGKEETLLGTFTYDIAKEPTQTFPLQNELPRAFQFMRLGIRSNWGKSGNTCIYRVQVHGKVTGTNAVGQARGDLLLQK